MVWFGGQSTGTLAVRVENTGGGSDTVTNTVALVCGLGLGLSVVEAIDAVSLMAVPSGVAQGTITVKVN